MKSAFDGLNGFQIGRLSAEERKRRWEQDRQTVADLWFRGDAERAQAAFDALPYSAIPDWPCLDRIMTTIHGAGREVGGTDSKETP